VVWKKLYKFQREWRVGAIDKLNRFGGCIIADSVGLGKTFERWLHQIPRAAQRPRAGALAPNACATTGRFTKTNDKRNVLAPDRPNYDVHEPYRSYRDGEIRATSTVPCELGNYDLW